MPSKELEAQFEAFFIEYEKKREARGWMPLEASHLVHMRNAWFASRGAVVVELPDHFRPSKQDVIVAIEAQGLKVKP